MANYAYKYRTFLNKDGGLAAIEATVDQGRSEYVEADVTISDCNRQVSLDFSFGSPRKKKARLAKLDKIILVMQAMRAELEKCEVTGRD
jgi:hypothetical protein